MPGPDRGRQREELRRGLALDGILDAAGAGVAEGVAHDLGDRRRDPGLLGLIETEETCELPGGWRAVTTSCSWWRASESSEGMCSENGQSQKAAENASTQSR